MTTTSSFSHKTQSASPPRLGQSMITPPQVAQGSALEFLPLLRSRSASFEFVGFPGPTGAQEPRWLRARAPRLRASVGGSPPPIVHCTAWDELGVEGTITRADRGPAMGLFGVLQSCRAVVTILLASLYAQSPLAGPGMPRVGQVYWGKVGFLAFSEHSVG